jgi:hypothetical protein
VTIAEKLANGLDEGTINLGQLVTIAAQLSVREDIYANSESDDYYLFLDSSNIFINWQTNTITL